MICSMGTRVRACLLPALFLAGCGGGSGPGAENPKTGDGIGVDDYAEQRAAMVADQMRDVEDPAVLRALGRVKRHLFVPPELAHRAYEDRPLAIGRGQTISQPYIVALMTQVADLEPGDRVLEVGTGSGYQAAVLAELGCRVWTIEIIPELHRWGGENLDRAGYGERIRRRCGDGYAGWPEAAPFDAILVTAAPRKVPPPLKEQLKVGGRLVIPVGEGIFGQSLVVLERTARGYRKKKLIPVRFVPLVRKKKE